MFIIDAHLDISYNALQWNRDQRMTVAEIRRLEAGMAEKGRGTNTVAFPELRAAEVGICLATVLARANPKGKSSIDFRNQEIAFAAAQGQLAYYRALQADGVCHMIRDWTAFQHTAQIWQTDGVHAPFGFVLSMEGADPILSPSQAEQWWNNGLRAVGLAHYGPSAYAHGTGSSGGLSPKGRDLLRAMSELGMILDVTHLSDESFWEALNYWQGPVLASHNNCRALVPGVRQFADQQIKAIIERGAVIGAAFDAWMLAPQWSLTMTPKVQLEAVIDQIDHICQIAGNARHVAIGSDLDGGYGTEQTPEGLDTRLPICKRFPDCCALADTASRTSLARCTAIGFVFSRQHGAKRKHAGGDMLSRGGCCARQQRLLEVMRRKGWDSFLTADYRTVYYFTGVLSQAETPAIFLFSRDAGSVLVTSSQTEAAAKHVLFLKTYTIERPLTHLWSDASRLLEDHLTGKRDFVPHSVGASLGTFPAILKTNEIAQDADL
jgi:membrane dipeptidase